MSEAKKFDEGKAPWHLAPWDAFGAVVRVLAFGATKYDERNWENGMDWSRLFGALQRHLTAWWQGEGKDDESGMSHLWHAGCCIMFLIAYEMRGVGKDDRPAKPFIKRSAGVLPPTKVGYGPPGQGRTVECTH
jgi:hypothetical protein